MKTLPLTKGYVALIDDDCDADRFKWTALVTGQHVKRVYAYRRTGWDNAKRRWTGQVLLHRYVLPVAEGLDVDHIDKNTLDCRKQNLRPATRSQNLANSRRALGACGFRGVTFNRAYKDKPYQAQASRKLIGRFSTARAAALAFDEFALKKFGEFATLNFPIGAPTHGVSETKE